MPLPPGFTEIAPSAPASSAGGLPPGFSEVSQEPDWMQVTKDAVNEAHFGNGSKLRDLLTNPITQAKALPYLTGVAGAISGLPMGATAGVVGGRQVSNAALKTYGHPEEIPSGKQQVMEGAGAALGDLTAIPAINRKIFGNAVGQAERGAGVPAPQDIRPISMPTGTKSIGDFITDAVDSVKGSGGRGNPVYWKQIKDQVDRIYKLDKDQPLTTLDQGRLRWLNQQVQQGLNTAVSGRAEPAASLAMSQYVPNKISSVGKAINKLPLWMKIAGGTALGIAGGDTLKQAMSGVGMGGGR